MMSDSTNIVCPDCLAVNRLPAHKLSDRPVCGKCKQPLFTDSPLELHQSSFDRHLSRDEVPLLIDFWAPWCGPCKAMAPAFRQAANELQPKIRLAKLNTESEPGIATRFKVSSIPTLVLFRGGKELKRKSGAMTATEITTWVKSVLA